MPIVDTHCHATTYWFEPIEILLDQMTRNDVDHAVLIQINGVFDNSYLVECMRRFPGRFSGAGMVDVSSPDAPTQLAEFPGKGIEGVRLNAANRSPGEDPLVIWRKAEELGLIVSCGGQLEAFSSPDFEEIIKTLPNLKVIIEHLGAGGRDTEPYDAYRRVLALAQYPNAYMKIPGLGEICARPTPFLQPFPFAGNVPPLVEMAVEAFGANRLMWGSDFPPVAFREGYRNALRWPMEHVTYDSDEDKEWIFGGTAASLFRFGA